ncbi:MAG: hypothetical protein HRT44_12780 [Bdellovibrionales bacterium]|nr:hypothetical protein [Bdellovibrionales bacterium]
MRVSGDICGGLLKTLGKMCKKDKMTKDAITSLTEVKCIPTDIKKSPYLQAKRNGNVFEVMHHPVKTSGSAQKVFFDNL